MHTTGCAFANGVTRCTFAIGVKNVFSYIWSHKVRDLQWLATWHCSLVILWVQCGSSTYCDVSTAFLKAIQDKNFFWERNHTGLWKQKITNKVRDLIIITSRQCHLASHCKSRTLCDHMYAKIHLIDTDRESASGHADYKSAPGHTDCESESGHTVRESTSTYMHKWQI